MANVKKKRLAAIEYIRAVSMLGVIGIHVGSQYLMNPMANVHLVALFEIVTRFSVPIFFFISAFGLFYKLDLNVPLDYSNFIRRRFKAVLIPYLLWSFLYLIHDDWYYGVTFLDIGYIIKVLFFGLAKYQLYFLVILLWFYALMPLWIEIVKWCTMRRLLILLIVQTAFNYFSSYSTILTTLTYSLPADSFLHDLLSYRLNYLVLHYVFIFVLGGYLAVHKDEFFDFMKQHKLTISISFIASLAVLLAHYYFVIFFRHLPPEAAVNTAHQLSPAGIIYTICACVFWFMLFTHFIKESSVLQYLGKHSFFIYLVHPLVIVYLNLAIFKLELLMTAPVAILFYLLTAAISMVLAHFFD